MSYAKTISVLLAAMVMVAGFHLVAYGANSKKDYYGYGKNRGNPANKYDPANPEGQAKKYAPDNPNNPANKYDPANPESAGSKYNPDTPLKPR